MKNKFRTLLLVICLMMAFGTVAVSAGESDIALSSLNTTKEQVTVVGTSEGAFAIAAQIRDSSDNIIAITSAGVDDNNEFTVSFMNLNLSYGTYTLYLANYEGGDWTIETFTLSAPTPTPSGNTPNPSGTTTDPSDDTPASTGEDSADKAAEEKQEETAEPEVEQPKAIEDVIADFTETDKDSEAAKLLSQLTDETTGTETSEESISIEVSKGSTQDADSGKLEGGVFKNEDGEVITNSFVESTNNGKMYFADAEGKKVTNSIVTDGENLYYCGKSGAVVTDKAVNIGNGVTVLTDNTGAIITKSEAKITVGGKAYITGEGGVVQKSSAVTITATTKKNGKTVSVERTYITNKKGVVQTGLVKFEGKQYITSKTGIVRKNKMTTVNGKKMFTNKKGYVVKNKTFTYNGETYKANKKGYVTLVKSK